jgi:hypothetical protein
VRQGGRKEGRKEGRSACFSPYIKKIILLKFLRVLTSVDLFFEQKLLLASEIMNGIL